VTRALAYLRISQDRDATMRSVDNQRSEIEALAKRLGLTIAETYLDDDISAYSGRRRPGYEQLRDALAVGPATLLVWHVDRLYRQPRELEALLDLVEQNPVRIEAVRGGGLDLNSHEGRLQARLLVSMASYESAHKADRIRLANRRGAERGDWHGPRRFGYQLTGDGSATIDPVEGPVVREAVERLLAGESIRSITGWVNTTGVPPLQHKTNSTQAWHTNSIRQLLAAPRIAGRRSYDPENQGKGQSVIRQVIGPGRWPGIITPAEHERVVAILRNPDRRTSRSGENLLSGIATCSRCGAGLVIASSGQGPKARRRYVCKKLPGRPERGGVSIEQRSLDAAVSEAVVLRLAATPAPPRLDDDTSALWGAVASARQRLDDLATDYGSGDLDRRSYQVARTAATEKLEQAERALRGASRGAAVGRLPLGNEAALRERWAAMTVGQQRAVLGALVDELVIKPAERRSRSLDLGRVDLRWRA